MGWCHEFGPQIAEDCDHPMVAGSTSCSCAVCGTVCIGRFAGCAEVWARGPKDVSITAGARSRSGNVEPSRGGNVERVSEANGDRWRLPLDPMRKLSVAAEEPGTPVPLTLPPAETTPAPSPILVRASVATAAPNGFSALAELTDLEPPDVTARFVVAQLAELNERLAAITELATKKGDATLEKVQSELSRITSLREVDLTEQAAGIFSAVQAGAGALDQFATVVNQVTTDLRLILEDSLASIGGTQGLADRVVKSAAEVSDVRKEIRNAFARIERDMSALRNQQPVETVGVKLDDDQLTFIVEAVAESVLRSLNAERLRNPPSRR